MYTVVGLIMNGEKISGFRVIKHDTLERLDVSKSEAKELVRQFTNLKLHNGHLRGKSGVLDKYGIVGSDETKYTILHVLTINGNKVGFEVADNNGNIKRYTTDTIMKIYDAGKITNGRLNVNGISAIKGTFAEKEVKVKRG